MASCRGNLSAILRPQNAPSVLTTPPLMISACWLMSGNVDRSSSMLTRESTTQRTRVPNSRGMAQSPARGEKRTGNSAQSVPQDEARRKEEKDTYTAERGRGCVWSGQNEGDAVRLRTATAVTSGSRTGVLSLRCA